MATISGVQRAWQVDLMVTETSTSIENNTSSAYWELWVRRTDSGSYPIMGTPTINIYVSGILAHSSSEYRNEQNITSAGRLWLSGTVTGIPHNEDGTIVNNAISFSWTGVDFSPNNVSASGVYSTATIPRASEISSVSTADIGSNATISVNRKSSSFTHTITYSFGNLSGTIVTKSSNTSITWTIPTSFYAQIPNSKTGTGTLTITTYNGNTQIGSSKTKSFSVTTNENQCKPVVDASVVDSNQTTINVTGNNKILIAGYSTANVSYTATPKNSASIKTITVNNSSAYIGTSSSAVSGTKAITNFNANKIDIVAKDSRTYPTTKTLTAGTTDYTLINYVPLTFSGSVSRQTPTGNVLLLSFSGNYFNDNLGATANALTITWKYKEKGASDWVPNSGGTLVQGTDYTIDTTNNTYSSGSGSYQSTILLGNIFDYQTNYEIGIFYNDVLVSNQIVLQGLKGQPIVNWSEDYFNVNGEFKINNVQMQVNASSTVSGGIKMRLSGSTLYITNDGSNP